MNALKSHKAANKLTIEDLMERLECSRASVTRYLAGKREIPPRIAANAEKNLGIPRHLLRPDIWDAPVE